MIATLCLFMSIRIVKNWNIEATTPLQYSLEKSSVLVATFIKYIFVLKLPLFLFFIFSLDKLSDVITGAMCAAGVVNSVSFGMYLVMLKLFNIYLFGFWLALHVKDSKDEKRALTKAKFWLFITAYFFLIIEIIYEFSYFHSLNVDKIVSCCGTLFSATSSSSLSLIFLLSNTQVVVLFYASLVLHLVSLYKKIPIISILSSILFLVISIIAVILFFGTYIYELPTHHCPFCFLQKDYHYVGYIIYVTLFCSTFFSLVAGIFGVLDKGEILKKYYMISFYFSLVFAFIVSSYPVVYYLKNGVWL
jgi:hypothetical protein